MSANDLIIFSTLSINWISESLLGPSIKAYKSVCFASGLIQRDFKVYFDDAFSPVNTTNKDFYLKLRGSFFKNEKILNIKSKTINEITSVYHKNSDIDFVNIDVEGSDYEILKQIDLSKFHVKLIAIETHPIDNIESDSVPQILNFLNKNNFTLYKKIGPTSLFRKQ